MTFCKEFDLISVDTLIFLALDSALRLIDIKNAKIKAINQNITVLEQSNKGKTRANIDYPPVGLIARQMKTVSF